jgi:putative hydrolase of the HAD superfamily
MDKVRKPNAGKAFTYWQPVLKEWGIKISEKEFWDYWFKAERPSEEMIALAKNLRKNNIKVITLSNNFRERAEHYEHYPWMNEIVTKAYFSWQTGFVKPDKKAWELVLREQGLEAEECIYFDDQEKNLKAAESLGIRSFMFTTKECVENIINKEK